MTRDEAAEKLEAFAPMVVDDTREALDMAIEALQEPKTIIGIDIPYGSDKGIATIFKGKDDKLTLEEVKEIMTEPVKHGEWETRKGIEYCSECNASMMWQSTYCPNCGAKMDGGKDEK